MKIALLRSSSHSRVNWYRSEDNSVFVACSRKHRTSSAGRWKFKLRRRLETPLRTRS